MTIKIICSIPNPNDATNYYRGTAALCQLRHMGLDIELMFIKNPGWSQMFLADILFLQRPYSREHVEMAETAKQCNVPVWVDYDDDVFRIPKDNPHEHVYSDHQTRCDIFTCLEMAHVITTATNQQKQNWYNFRKDIIVVNNAWDDYRYPLEPIESFRDQSKTVIWRGTSSHERDLEVHESEIFKAAKSNKNFRWVFIGHRPNRIMRELGDQAVHIPMLQLLQFRQKLMDLKPWAGLVPLEDTLFNRCKSNIAWLELTQAGALVAAQSDFPEWQSSNLGRKGYISLSSQLSEICEMTPSERLENLAIQRDQMNSYRLSQVNQLRADIIKRLCHR